ncbi:MAG: hypothetical protein II362_05290 [Alistipes sp.]|nr:hypothetical protein [Alistipes sp.]MBR0330605.1 hypothetical protein [Alistipes sp.]
MKKYLLLLMALCVAVTLSSCRKTMEKMREKVEFIGVEDVRLVGLTSLEIDFSARNDTAYNLVVKEATITLLNTSTELGALHLSEPVTVKSRTTGTFTSRWRIEIGNPLQLLSLASKLRNNDLSGLFVSIDVDGRGGPVPVNISRERVPLSEILSKFGADISDLSKLMH